MSYINPVYNLAGFFQTFKDMPEEKQCGFEGTKRTKAVIFL